ncbi:hybrid sensor histidine kinase/response regulator [Persicimonas caeni]|nr:ATP-binding protein [Persicimonas caeni]
MAQKFFTLAPLDRLLTRRLPDELRSADTIEAQQAKLLLFACAGSAVLGLLFTLIFWFSGNEWLCVPTLVGTVAVLTPPVALHLGYSVATAGHILALQAYLSLCAMVAIAGGLRPEALVWLFCPPVIAMIFAGYRAGGAWTLLSIATCFGFYGIEQYIADFPDMLDENSPVIAVGVPVAVVSINSLLYFLNARLQKWLARSLTEAQKEALEASHRGFQTLLERSPDALLVLRDDEPIYVNPAFVELSGYTLEELRRVDPNKMIPAVELEQRRQHEKALLSGDAASEVREGTRIRRDGTKIDVETRSFVAPFGDEPAVFVNFRDVTERKHLQAKMMQMDRMIAVGTLAAGVAHEINNPLAFMTGNVTLLLSELEQGAFDNWQPPADSMLDHDELREVLDDVTEGAERIRAIVSSLRAFAREQEDADLDGSVDILALLDSCTKMAQNEIKHRARLVTDFGEVPAVRGDNSQLGQVFLNLIVNAAHAVPAGHHDDNEIRVSVTSEDDTVIVRVSDTGTGIPAHIQSHIFDPFFTTKGERDGMGLGLYITQNIVHDHGGEICFQTAQDKGTTFEVRLPSTEYAPADTSRPLPTVDSSTKLGHALIVDDEEKILRTLERALSNFEIDATSSAATAVEWLRGGQTYDVILCDLLMPQMSGMEFYETLEAAFPHLAERVVFMSGGTFTNGSREFVASCGRPLVAKPFDIDKLQTVLSEQVRETKERLSA